MVRNRSFNHFRTANYYIELYVALYVYDCLVTMDQEVNNIWLKKWTLSTWIYALNRYAALVSIILDFIPQGDSQVRRLLFILNVSLLTIARCHLYRSSNPFIVVMPSSLTKYQLYSDRHYYTSTCSCSVHHQRT